ncbi:MAG: RNA methyltransferase [Bacteroidetes bacterium]|nr:RNA methyltransferase [Bacteroidota bacterium]
MHRADELIPSVTKELIEYLRCFATEERFSKFREAVHFRTRHLTIALEDIFQSHNASAVLRTCDCFGIQDVHIIENRNKYEVNPDVALGASKWLDLIRYNEPGNNTVACITRLKKEGYRVVATTPHKDGFIPGTLPLHQKTALIFGTEMAGLTPEALELADDFIRIPMVGFTESLNISVSAAIFMQNLTTRLRNSDIRWQLSDTEKDEILVNWLRQSIKKSDMIIDEFLEKKI